MTEPTAPRILAETDRWLVLSKPPRWLTVPGRETPLPVLSAWASLYHGGSAGRVWTVHRLDRDTSGVVLFAKTAEAHREANGWFSRHEVRKSYDLIAAGAAPAVPILTVRRPIAGAASITQVEIGERYAGAFLAHARPVTGRRHQIRIHLSGEGHPLCGDPEYGGPTSLGVAGRAIGFARVALHARRLELPSREVFEAPWPEDFSAWVRGLREAASGEGGETRV